MFETTDTTASGNLEVPGILNAPENSDRSLVWHYTVGACYEGIVREGIIKPASDYVPKHERLIVWFSTNPYWEATANKACLNPNGKIEALTMSETAERGGGLFVLELIRMPLRLSGLILKKAAV